MWISESSDTTHEAILHNVVAHQLELRRQVREIQADLESVKFQLAQVLDHLQVLLGTSEHGTVNAAEAERGQQEDGAER